MSHLKKETLNQCFSLLREFIHKASDQNNRKGVAIMALNQLERVTAGTTETLDTICIDTPLADGLAAMGQPDTICIDTPLADGAPAPGGG